MSTPSLFTVLADDRGTLTWLGQFPSVTLAAQAMTDWLHSDDRDDDDTAFIVPVLAFGRPSTR